MNDALISPEYLIQLQTLHAQKSDWGTSGGFWATEIAKYVHDARSETVLDYGCGKGVLIAALQELIPDVAISGYDPAVEQFASTPQFAFDVVTCVDVLEHIEPDKIDAVLRDISDLTSHAAFFVISIAPAKAILPDGRNAHLIVESEEFWLKKLEDRFGLVVKVNKKQFSDVAFWCFYPE